MLVGMTELTSLENRRAWHTRQRSKECEAVDALDTDGQRVDSGVTMTRRSVHEGDGDR